MMTGQNTKFESIVDVIDHFSSQEKCKKFLEVMRWGTSGNIICPHCKHENAYRTKPGYKCSNNKCYKKFSVITRTIFEGTKIPLRKWFIAMYMIITDNTGVSASLLSRQLRLNIRSAWFLLHRLRVVMKSVAEGKLSSLVEIDESMYGGRETNKPKYKRSGKRGKHLGEGNKTYLVGAVETDTGRLIIKVSDDISQDYLIPFINEHVEKNTIIVTDAYNVYDKLPANGYTHIANKHSKYKFTRTVDGIKYHTQTIEGVWSHFKVSIRGTHKHVTMKHLQKYADEFSYRRNIREMKSADRFNYFFADIENKRLKYDDLIRRNTK